MKRIVSIGIGIFTITLLSLCSNNNSSKNSFKKSENQVVNDTVTLSIDSANARAKFADLFFYYHDSLYQSHGIGIKSGQVNFSINTPVILIDAVDKQTPYFVNPGEKIQIKYAGTDSIGMYISDNIQRTNELNFFRKMVKKTGSIWYFVPDRPYHGKVNTIAQIHDWEKTIDSVKNDRLKFLVSYSKQSDLSDSFMDVADKCIKITAISDSLFLYRRNRDMLIQQHLYESLIFPKTTSIEAIGFMPNQFYYRACSVLLEMAEISSNQDGDFKKSFKFITRHFTSLTKDYLLSRAVYSDFKNKIPISKANLSQFDSECHDLAYRNQIHRILAENSKALEYVKGSNKLLSLDGKSVQDLNEVIAKYKGKVVMFDFWASWCSPCRGEMPYTATLKKKYKGKNIVFVSISTDGNIADWKKAAKEEALTSDNDYLLLNADQASFIKKYAINSIPRYMLIGKEGQIVEDDAPRPSDQKLETIIDRLL